MWYKFTFYYYLSPNFLRYGIPAKIAEMRYNAKNDILNGKKNHAKIKKKKQQQNW